MISYEDRVQQLELEGCTTSDAQSVADCEVLDGTVAPPGGDQVTHDFFQSLRNQ
jgi:hypothetical protein